jgi:hypothetical protein
MYPLALTRTLRPRVMELLNSGKAQLVYPEDNLDIGKLWLAAPSAFVVSRELKDFQWNVEQFDFVSLDNEPETWNLKTREMSRELVRLIEISKILKS